MHVSVHDPAYGLHVKVKGPEGEASQVARNPDPLTKGVVRLMQVRIPPAAATYESARQDVHWVEAPVEPERWIAFEIIAELRGAITRQAEWDRGCVVIGRVPTSDRGSLAIAAWQMKGEGGSWTLPATDAQKQRVREAAASGTARVLIQGINPDGSLWFLDLAGESQGPG